MTSTTAPRQPEHDGDLVLRGVSLRYGTVTALRSIDLAVRRGSIVALLGANGAGKTSVLRAVSGNTRVHHARLDGSIRWGGREMIGRTPVDTVRAGIGQVPEGRRVFARMTVHDNLVSGRVTGSGGHLSVEEAYELFPVLAERRRQSAGYLSGGEQQQLAIARALMSKPDLLMLDEPSLGLAPKTVGRIMEVIRRVNAAGTSILLIEQNAAMALELADEATVLELGRVALVGPSDDPALQQNIQELYFGSAARAEEDAPVRSRPTLTRWTTTIDKESR